MSLPKTPATHDDARSALRGPLAMLLFGLSILAYLVVIDRVRWFEVPPASVTAGAVWHAAQPPAASPKA